MRRKAGQYHPGKDVLTMSRHILEAIGRRLVPGSCPADPKCRFASGDNCYANAEHQAGKFLEITNPLMESGALIMQDRMTNSGFPCDDYTVIYFVDCYE